MASLRVLGPVEVVVDGRAEPVASAKQRLVLAVLAAHRGAPVPRSRLIDALWGEDPPPSAAGTLMAYVSRLRATFGASLVGSHPEGYVLGADVLDAEDFERAASGAVEAADLERALALWRDDEAFGALADHPFLLAESRRLRELRTQARIRLASLHLERGDASRPASMLEALLADEPLREDAWVLLLRSLLAGGRPADAARAAHRARRRLAEVGLEPSAALAELEATALQQRVEADVGPVRYARHGDVHLAHQVVGDGPLDLVLSSYGSASIDSIWDSPPFTRFVEDLAGCCRLVLYDTRGVGLSDPIDVEAPPTIEEQVADLDAVRAAAGGRPAIVVGVGDGGPVAIASAARSPGVAGLVLVNAFARLVAADDHPIGVPRERFEANLAMSTDPASSRSTVEVLRNHAPSVADDPAFRRWWERAGRRGASPATATALWRVRYGADVRPLLPCVAVPTLVLHRRGTRVVPFVHGQHLAACIPGARLVELEGADQPPFTQGAAAIVAAIRELVDEVGGRRPPPPVAALG